MIQRVAFSVETPAGVVEHRSLQEVLALVKDELVQRGHRPGYFVRVSVDVVVEDGREDQGADD